jgi:hypothetical protein
VQKMAAVDRLAQSSSISEFVMAKSCEDEFDPSLGSLKSRRDWGREWTTAEPNNHKAPQPKYPSKN